MLSRAHPRAASGGPTPGSPSGMPDDGRHWVGAGSRGGALNDLMRRRRMGRSGQNSSAGTLQLLSLFLILLVVFILLNAQTVESSHRMRAVLQSLEEGFPTFFVDPRLRSGHQPVASRSGTVFAVQRLESLGELFATTVAVAKVDVVSPGELMEVRLPADGLFMPGTADLRPDRQGLIDRMSETLISPLADQHIALEAYLAIDVTTDSGHAPGPVARAGALARLLTANGVPPDTVTIGIERGQAGWARLRFVLREEDSITPPGVRAPR